MIPQRTFEEESSIPVWLNQFKLLDNTYWRQGGRLLIGGLFLFLTGSEQRAREVKQVSIYRLVSERYEVIIVQGKKRRR